MVDPKVEHPAWVFDSLVGFLHGPIWNVPLQTFIEEKSLLFEPTEDGNVCDKPEYKKIHSEYRNLVDTMLGSFMEDIGISAEQFEEACRASRRELDGSGLPLHFHRRLFEQVWAANDYAMFTKMMTHKNVELQLQALELIEQRFGGLPNLFVMDELDYPDTPREHEWPAPDDDIMTQIKELQLSDNSDDDDVAAPERSRVDVVAEKRILEGKLAGFVKGYPEPVAEAFSEKKSENPPDATYSAPAKRGVSAEEVQQRQEYLTQQRDKLLALKRQVRERQLAAGGGGGEAAAARPASARAARALLAGTAPAPIAAADATLQLRRALAGRLKAEVVDSNH